MLESPWTGGSGYHGPLGSSTRGHTRRAAPAPTASETSKVNEGLCGGAPHRKVEIRPADCRRAPVLPRRCLAPAGFQLGRPREGLFFEGGISRPISRVLYGPVDPRGSPGRGGHSSGTAVAGRLEQPTRATGLKKAVREASRVPPLFGFAPGGVCRAVRVAASAVRSYRTLSPLPRRIPKDPRCGGLLSVALSLGSPPPDVIRHRLFMEPGLSSPDPAGQANLPTGPERPPGRLMAPMCDAGAPASRRGGPARRARGGLPRRRDSLPAGLKAAPMRPRERRRP